MRTRPLKPSFCKNETIAECSPWARLLLQGLWMMADRNGRLLYRPKKIKAEVFPHDDSAVCDVETNLKTLIEQKLITVYEADDMKCIAIPNFKKNARPHPKEPVEDIPEPGKNTAKVQNEPGKNTAYCRESSWPVLNDQSVSNTGESKEQRAKSKSANDPETDPIEKPTDPEADLTELVGIYDAKVGDGLGPNGRAGFRHLIDHEDVPKATLAFAIAAFAADLDRRQIHRKFRPSARSFVSDGTWRSFADQNRAPPSDGLDLNDPEAVKLRNEQENERIRKANE